jgi:hypothetical protein
VSLSPELQITARRIRVTWNDLIRTPASICCGLIAVFAMLVGSVTVAAAEDNATGVTAGSGTLRTADGGAPFLPRGFNSVGILYPTQYADKLCTQPGNKPGSNTGRYMEQVERTMTTDTSHQVSAMIEHWDANTVRFQVSQGALVTEHDALEQDSKAPTPYTDMVKDVVAQARAARLITIVSMQTEPLGCTPFEKGKLQKLPDQLTEKAWDQLLKDWTLTKDPGLVLEVFNEPNTEKECGQASWQTWATGCDTEPDQGMLTVGKYVRSLEPGEPNNVLLFDGDNNAEDFTDFRVPDGMPDNSAYAEHPYRYVTDVGGTASLAASEDDWATRFGYLPSSGHTVVVTEWNEEATCPKDPNQTVTHGLIEKYLPDNSIGLMAHSWDAPGRLVNPITYAPIDSNSSCDHTGAGVVHQQFLSEGGGS